MVFQLLTRRFDLLPVPLSAKLWSSFLVQQIVALNVFGCPRTTMQTVLGPTSPEQREREKVYHTTGIFIKASHINHSCYSNARRSFIGNMIIVRAARDIPADSEVFFWYAAPVAGRTWEKKQEKLKNWEFECSCVICQQDKKTAKKFHTKRNALSGDLKAAFQAPGGGDLPKAERVLAAFEKTYSAPAKDIPRLEMWDPYLFLARIYASQNKPELVIRTAFKVLISLGFVMAQPSSDSPNSILEVLQWGLVVDYVIEVWMHLWSAYAKVAPHLCEKAEEYAKISYKICIGEDETFDENVGWGLHEAVSVGMDLGTAFQQLKMSVR